MKNQKNERGITLVALVVTIVVLLILAGITIMYVMSDSGVFGTAKTAGEDTERAAVQEAVSTALISVYPEVYTGTAGTDGKIDLTTSFGKNLSKSMTATGYTVKSTAGDVSDLEVTNLIVTYKGKTYTVTYSTEAEENLKNGTGGVLATLKTTTP